MIDGVATLNFKIPRGMHEAFKTAAKKHGATMQAILYSLTENYIENSDFFKVRLIDIRKEDDNGGTV